ncbi:MAG: ABC-F family ATP-binding cassette domain-containing protein [Balneolaceae bacterium]
MTYLSVEQLSKNYGLKPLFDGLTFGISKGDKTALVAPNGTGKSTLLKVLAGKETPDNGEVMVRNGIRMGFLEQEPELDNRMTISEFIARGNSETVTIIRRYEKAAQAQAENFNEDTQKAFEKALSAMDSANAWDYEQRMQQILGKLNIHDLDQSVASLSGGERKRVALAFVLLENPDLLLLDEPTNHLDVDMIEWLEHYLARSTTTLLMVTHDRYFLDRVCNHIIEIDCGNLYHHKGNYAYYLEKKAERQEIEEIETGKAGQLLKKELEWMRRSPKARTTKSKSRINAFYETEDKARQKNTGAELRLEVNMQRMGNKILELDKISKRFGDTVILDDFSYSFKRGERIGIIGRNGAGKSTFLNIITGEEQADSGTIDKGTTIVFGHYRQKGIQLDENMRVIDVMKEIAEVIELADGKKISASQFLEHFMFSPEMQYTKISSLSGGERRRLGLMMVLIRHPNFLILDEPTNDLDLMTLNRLEDFLQDFGGCLIVVSHDRFFMDKLVQHYFIFEGNGMVRDHNGTYQEYRAEIAEQEVAEKAELQKQKTAGNSKSKTPPETGKGKLSFKERKRFQQLEKEIEQLEAEKTQLETAISSGNLSYGQLEETSARYAEIKKVIDKKSVHWLELAELE